MRILKIMATGLIGILAAISITIGIARATMPATSCTVTEAQIDTLVLEKTTYAEVASKLGCDGVKKVKLDAGQLKIENISWRGDAWPYAKFEGHFINGVLHGVDKRWIRLNLTW